MLYLAMKTMLMISLARSGALCIWIIDVLSNIYLAMKKMTMMINLARSGALYIWIMLTLMCSATSPLAWRGAA